MQVYGHDDAPHGHMHVRFTMCGRRPITSSWARAGDSRLPRGGWGRGGYIIACAPSVRPNSALERMCKRALEREAFGKPIAHLGANYDILANARMEIEQAGCCA